MISNTTKSFWTFYNALPKNIQKQAIKTYKTWRANSYHPSLFFKPIHSTELIYSVRISRGYCALGLREDDTITWFWIGSHSEYEKLISRI